MAIRLCNSVCIYWSKAGLFLLCEMGKFVKICHQAIKQASTDMIL